MLLSHPVNKNSPYLFFIKFLLCFFTLYFLFHLLRGVTGVGGNLYSSFIAERLNVIKGLTEFLTGAAKLVLRTFNFNVHQVNYHTLRIEYSKGISVNPSCLGWAVMSFWVAFVYANLGGRKYKLKWGLIGLATVVLLNISRISLIAVAHYRSWQTITSLDHHQTFNIASYGCIFILMFLYIRDQKKSEKVEFERKSKEGTVSTI